VRQQVVGAFAAQDFVSVWASAGKECPAGGAADEVVAHGASQPRWDAAFHMTRDDSSTVRVLSTRSRQHSRHR